MDFDVRASPAPAESGPWSREPPAGSQNHYTHQTPDLRQPTKRHPNRVKAKAANPHVISSILDSLEDTLTPLPVVERSDQQSDTASKHSRQDSSNRSVASTASIHRNTVSPGFGVEYGNSLSLDDEESVSGAAIPPTIPTSRPPSGLSHYTAKRRPSFSKSNTTAVFRNRASSRRSSFSGSSIDRPGSRRNKLSSESWVRKNQDSDARSDISRGRTPRKSLRRVSSQEMLRSTSREFSSQPTLEAPPVSLAEKIIARTPPPISTSKGRLYLTDVTVNEDQPIESPILPTPISQTPPLEQRPIITTKLSSSDSQLSVGDGGPIAKAPSPISDSIPTRTSSLRQSNSPAGTKKKHRKSKRHTVTPSKSETMSVKQISPSIPDSSWIDLGEEDETVKRIKELRERRKSRLQDSTSYASPIESPHEETDAKWAPVYELSAPPAAEPKRGSRTRPVANRASTEPGAIQHLLGVKGEKTQVEDVNGAAVNGTNDVRNIPATKRRNRNSLELKRPASAHYRPATSKSDNSPIPPPSLDYSYARAVDLLNSIDYDQEERSRESSDRGSLQLKGLDIPPPKQSTLAPPPHNRSAKKPTKRSPSDRWTAVHPDLLLDFDKKRNRRKSMSDARHAKTFEDVQNLQRRDSIEDAVEHYLSDQRLSRTIKSTSGRTIAFSEVGDPEGAAVFVCVGMGLTRYVTAFFDELATTLRLRLITLDRPGVGGSDPFPPTDKSGPLNWPEDVLAVCQHLGIVKFSILAHSAGAIYALATALILPHLVKGKVHLLAPWVPPSQLEAISHTAASAPPSNPLPRSQRFLRVLPTPFLKAANSSFMTATSASLKPATKRNIRTNANRTPPRRTYPDDGAAKRPTTSDRPEYNRRESMMLMDQFMPNTNPLENFLVPVINEEDNDASMKRGSLVLSATAGPMDPSLAYATNGLNAAEHAERERQVEYTSRLTQRTWDLATRDSNPATDLLVCLERHRDVGFRYTDVGREVVITHGSEDKRVPIANVKWLGEQMNRRALGLHLDNDARESRKSWADATAKGGCEVRVLSGEGHGLMASPIIMGDVLTEIAGYWVGQHNGRL
ncbi:hypothetical protein M409DRAFT_16887 [Zasmidium cellare ATCC 36951]|uniref:AB hydrolase-1 domain-containing protein n=1 Tax=Zasmidium cellare ATCC 36951 TaxID=1080233 RepID=A0A6A6D0I1_ZASCE|nr:uncharacterized protein M409DRAFT_16887 [Zasmidium cellare ATCC 36951]KAF2172934.1 hypothetical protein M409DRAFT_16887 [Zasmidium cellare ATCC 36951]